MSKPDDLKPSVRIDGARRTDLADLRTRQAAAREAKASVAPVEDTRVAEVWEREAAREGVAKRAAEHDRRMAKLRAQDGLKEGAKVTIVKVRISEHRYDNRAIRARPGTFEWRYGRNKQDTLFHAGSHFAQLWERAGATVASSADFLRGTRSGHMTGIADGRVAAYDALRGSVESIGQFSFERLMLYCVHGLTAAEIAQKEGRSDREIATVLHNDLRECARHFKFLGLLENKARFG